MTCVGSMKENQKPNQKLGFSLQSIQDSPWTKCLRSSFVVIDLLITAALLGRQSPSRSSGGTQKRSSEFGPRTHPLITSESPENVGDFCYISQRGNK
jgi:hypothetical protein